VTAPREVAVPCCALCPFSGADRGRWDCLEAREEGRTAREIPVTRDAGPYSGRPEWCPLRAGTIEVRGDDDKGGA
jgi:hypothetical protein